MSWTYDRYGNRLSQTATKGTPPTNSLSVSTATNRVAGWIYDAAGNTLNDSSHTYTYDANNMIASVDAGSVQYKYDAGGRRVMKVTASETTYYAHGAEYSSVSGWRRIFVSAGGVKVEYRDNQTWFHQADHLGTPRVQTDSAGNLVETWSYYPFGEQWEQTGSGGNERRYTGHRRDPETGNDYAGARYLKGSKGRWLAVDPALGSTSNPQRLNRYAYVTGDAVNLVDRDGAEGGRPCLNRSPGQCGPRPPGEDPIPTSQPPSGIPPVIVAALFAGEQQDVAKQDQDRSPQPGPSIGSPNTSPKVDSAIEIALARLESKSCQALLGNNAAETLRRLRDENRIRYAPGPYYALNSNGTLSGSWVAMVPRSSDRIFINTRGPFDNPSNTFVWSAGKPVTHDFLRDWKREYGQDLTAGDLREGVILHELAHVLGVFGPDAPGTGDQWQLENSVSQNLIQDHCFNGVDVEDEQQER